jgi:chorismate mutase/prephenate dehydratase
VHGLLTPLAEHGVSMSRIESRPARARTALWEYLFFIDLEGHQNDERVAAALAELRSKAPYLKILGSYPAALS